jgi:hypothetical protein
VTGFLGIEAQKNETRAGCLESLDQPMRRPTITGREKPPARRVGAVPGAHTRCLSAALTVVRYALERWTRPRQRAQEVCRVRRRLSCQGTPPRVSAEEQRLARHLLRMREALAARFRGVEACTRCVRPYSPSWPGGHCCSGHTDLLFTDDELGALRLSGTTPARLRPPRAEPAGCAFRGPTGCSLEPAHRPCLCVRYTCRELEAELASRSDYEAIKSLQQGIKLAFDRFATHRSARLEREAQWDD